MTDKKHYRVPISIPDAAMLLGKGVSFFYNGFAIEYDDSKGNPFRYGAGPLSTFWATFADWKPIIPEPHWSDSATIKDMIPCFFWDEVRTKYPKVGYIAEPKTYSKHKTYYTDWMNALSYENAEPIRTEDK